MSPLKDGNEPKTHGPYPCKDNDEYLYCNMKLVIDSVSQSLPCRGPRTNFILKNVDMDPCDPNSASNSAYKRIRKSVTAMSVSRQSKKGLKKTVLRYSINAKETRTKRDNSQTTNLITTSPILLLLLLLLLQATIKHNKQQHTAVLMSSSS
jgi:hypothetical protein